MITINKHPYLCCFTKNSIEFEVTTDLQFDTATVFPELTLIFREKPVLGTNFLISFTNPENGNRETVNLVAVDGSNTQNYSKKWQIPDTSFSGSLTDLRNIVYEKLKQFQIFNAFYNIDFNVPKALVSPRVIITAKEAISELVMDWESNQPTATINKYIREVNSIAYHQPGVRDGYALKASLFVENSYNSGNFDFVTALDCILDENSIAKVDVSKYIDAEIEASWTEYPLPYEQELGYKAPNLRRYYVEFAESFANESEVFKVETEILYAHWGGASAEDEYNLNPIAAQNTSGQWLTWWPSGKRILKEQSDWLAWMNGAEEVTFNVGVQIMTNEGLYSGMVHYDVILHPFETFIFNTGYDANHLDEFLDTGLKVNYWEFKLYFPCEICNYIRFNFKRKTDLENSIITTGASPNINGRKSFQNFISPPIGVIYSSLYWDGNKWVYYYNGILQGVLNEDIQCPFGVFELTENSFLDYFEPLPINECEPSGFNGPEPFRYYFEKACLTKQIVYFNSFGIPESFILSAEFQQNITTSQELATRTESFALSNKFPQNYIFDAKNVISYNAETLMLSNIEAERLMPLINSTITYMVEKDCFIPVILNAGTTAVYKVNSFLQKIKLEMARANESDRVSYYPTLPDFEPQQGANGFDTCKLNRNLLNITDFGSVKAYWNGTQVGEFAWVENQYEIIDEPLTYEGIITFILTCQINGIEKTVQKQINAKWDELIYEFIYSGSDAEIIFQSTLDSSPMRIDWDNGTTEDVTITNDGVAEFYKSYSLPGKKTIRIFKPSFADIDLFRVYKAVNLVDISKFTALESVFFNRCVAGNYYFTGLKNLKGIEFFGTVIYSLNIGFQRNLELISLDGSQISVENFEDFILEIWNFRKAYNSEFEIRITSEVIISSVAQSCIDATGIYAGDGLSTYGITIVNI